MSKRARACILSSSERGHGTPVSTLWVSTLISEHSGRHTASGHSVKEHIEPAHHVKEHLVREHSEGEGSVSKPSSQGSYHHAARPTNAPTVVNSAEENKGLPVALCVHELNYREYSRSQSLETKTIFISN